MAYQTPPRNPPIPDNVDDSRRSDDSHRDISCVDTQRQPINHIERHHQPFQEHNRKSPSQTVRAGASGSRNDERRTARAPLPLPTLRRSPPSTTASTDAKRPASVGRRLRVLYTVGFHCRHTWSMPRRKTTDTDAKHRKTSAHPSEATYPCCIPALGELGDVTPCGGVCEYTPMAGTTRISCAQQFNPRRHAPYPITRE